MAEITLDREFGQVIYHTVKNNNFRINLEIGTQDAGGSTQCFMKAMDQLEGEKALYCIEIKDQYKDAIRSNIGGRDYVKVFNSTINYDNFLPKNFDQDVWFTPYNKSQKCYTYHMVRGWFEEDIRYLKALTTPGFLVEHKDLTFDAVLIDGGEFNGYSEFKLLENRAKCFMLDDCTNAYKCTRVYSELIQNKDWKLVASNPFYGNGYAVFIKNI